PGFALSADSMYVVYRADQDTNNVNELYSRPADGSGSVLKLNTTLPTGGSVADFLVSPDAARVVYRADQETDGRSQGYSRPADGRGTAVRLSNAAATAGTVASPDADQFPVAFQISPDSTRVAYLADQETSFTVELFSRPIDGSGAAVKVNDVLPDNAN